MLVFAFLVLLPGIASADELSDAPPDADLAGTGAAARPFDSAFVSCEPTTMTAGHAYIVKLTLKNTGTEAWATRSADDRIVLRGDEAYAITLPGGLTVEPGEECTFFLPITAPSAGHYAIQFRMEHNANAFGDVKTVEFTVEQM